ncbi:recombinase [Phaeobacter sp.]|uniref:recombinase n=1 Tax=Phaeobacter sp. TaxID=1902409 RepID=UPI0025F1BFB8|nr:recombinase [Phaeobacter sp.]
MTKYPLTKYSLTKQARKQQARSKPARSKQAAPPQVPRQAQTADLLTSLHNSIERLRIGAEDMLLRLQADDDSDGSTAPRIARLESLIRDSQKVEKTLVEQCQHQQPADGLDLIAARHEIESRLARLAASQPTTELSGRAQRP